jgi:hypothetical protein
MKILLSFQKQTIFFYYQREGEKQLHLLHNTDKKTKNAIKIHFYLNFIKENRQGRHIVQAKVVILHLMKSSKRRNWSSHRSN